MWCEKGYPDMYKRKLRGYGLGAAPPGRWRELIRCLPKQRVKMLCARPGVDTIQFSHRLITGFKQTTHDFKANDTIHAQMAPAPVSPSSCQSGAPFHEEQPSLAASGGAHQMPIGSTARHDIP